jgi:hypothetical protein
MTWIGGCGVLDTTAFSSPEIIFQTRPYRRPNLGRFGYPKGVT